MTDEWLNQLERLANAVVLRDGDSETVVIPALVAEIKRLRDRLAAVEAERDALREEMKNDDTIINGQAALLTGVVNAIRGEPAPLSMHSHHDVVDLVQELVKVRYQRKPLPERGGYVCDTNGVIDTNTITTMREVSYLHDEAVSAVASLIRSHEALRDRANSAERILAALREPSEAVEVAAHLAIYPEINPKYRKQYLTPFICNRTTDAIRAAVAAAEKEVGNGEHHPNTLADLLREAADEIEGSVRHEYGWPDVHPARELKFDRDMDIVTRLRSAAAEKEVDA